jgi:DNA-binding XRE family transcriptional regulator
MKLAEARRKAKMTLQDVSNIVGASPGHLSEIERGIKGPSLELAVKITQLFPTVQLATLIRSVAA